MERIDRNNPEELRVPIGVVILLQAAIAMLYIIPIESDARLVYPAQLRYFEPVLFLMPIVTLLLYRWQPLAGRWFAVAAPAAVVIGLQRWLPIPGSLALLSLSTGIAAGLIGPRAAGAVAAASLAALPAMLALGWTDGWQAGVAVAAILTLLLILLSTHHSAADLYQWSQTYYQDALRVMRENRERQGELQQALEDLAHANRQMTLLYERQSVLQRIAEEAERAKSSFVAKVSHEFRTPLNMIIGLASVMVENPQMYGRALPAPLLEDLRIIYRNCDHLASLVNDVLALSQLQAGSVVLHRETLAINEIIENALDVVRPLIHQKKLALSLDMPSQPVMISCDRTRIRQVILNLCSNAARFTDQGGITVRMEEKEPNVEISITDSGPGIHPDDMERIFEPFCQGPEQVWREKGGSGLGLTISKQFVELHGGRIWLESRLGEGTTFFVSLPRSMPLSPEAPAVRWINREWNWVERKRRPAVPALPNRPRLVVFDPTQEILPGVGQFAGQVELVTANSVGETVAEVQKTPAHAILVGGHTPAVVLQTLQAARQALPDTPLVGWAMPARVAPALQAGANHYLVKPVSLETLKQKLDTIPGPLRRVLIADDDNDTRQLLSRMVQLYAPGVALVSAATGGEALDLARLQPFDLMLLDVMMPEQNGLEVLAHIRGDPGTRDLPVIAISAQDIHETQPACTEMLVMMGQEVQLAKALECAVGISEILLRPVAEPYPVQ